MGSPPQEDDRIWNEALDLIIRLQNDPENPITHRMIQGWLRRSPSHEAAWSELCELHNLSGQVLVARQSRSRLHAVPVSRRAILMGGTAAAAGLAIVAGPSFLQRARADHETGTGEIRAVTLPDGSTATLGPDSAIRLAFSSTSRTVELLSGAGFFEVVPDAARAFAVVSDQLTATALGTAFEVSNEAGRLAVSVDHGLVGVSLLNGSRRQEERLGASEWLSFNERTTAVETGRKDVSQIAAWRSRLIFADRETVSSLVALIARWQGGQIIIADPTFGNERVSGVYDVTEPLNALVAVVTPFGGRVRTLSPYLTIVTRF